jgi:uncharacterized repeat protein (TIGR01451 family)
MKPLQRARNCATRTLAVSVIAMVLALPPAHAGQSRQTVVGSPSGTEESASRPAYDAYGNLVLEAGDKFNYLALSDGFARVQLSEADEIVATQRLSFDPFESKIASTSSPDSTPLATAQAPSGYLAQKWKIGIWGTGIGASGITASDIDGDGAQEIVAGGGFGFGGNRFWYILSYSTATGKYQQEWLSEQYSSTISRIVVADVTNSGQYAVYVALGNGVIRIYDAKTRELLDTFSSPFASVADFTIADVDNDGDQEIVTSSSSGIVVHHAETYAIEWQTTSYGSSDVEVANVDGDVAPEIVTTRRVIDGISHTLEWDYSSGFGAIVQLADIDGDYMAEIVAAESWYQINAFDADTQSPKWDIAVDLDIDALIVTDFDDDGVYEIVYGDGQWGRVHAIDSTTLVKEWSVRNPEHGVAGIGFGDADHDGVVEVLWGAGWTSTGSDHLFVASTVTRSIEWRSQDIGGPLSALDVGDVDNDGTEEIVMVSFESDSGYSDGIIFVYDAETYELEWQSAPVLGGRAWTGVHALVLADVDNDQVLEILIATADLYDGLIMAYDGVTHTLDWRTADFGGTFFSALAVADVDNDGQLEVVGGQDREHTGASGVYVRIFDGSTGVQEWRTTNLTYWGGVYDIDTGDFDEDGNPEILFSVSDGHAHVYDGVTRTQEWESSFSNTRAVAGIDVDQDGDTEILVATSSGQLYALDGQTHTQEWSEPLSGRSINSLCLADTNRDLVAELALTDNSYLYVRDAATREPVWQSEYLGTSAGNRGHLVVRDIDHDTRDEVVLGSNYALYVFTYSLLPYGPSLEVDQPLAVPGNTLRYTIRIINFSDDVLPAAMTDTLPMNATYDTGSLWASAGEWGLVGDMITWTVELAASDIVSLTFTVTVDPLAADGSRIAHTAIYTAAGFRDSRSASTLIDALPPTSTIVRPAAGEIVSGAAYTITGTAIDTVSGVECVQVRIDDGDWRSALGASHWTYGWTLPVTDEAFTVEARSVDNTGHVETPGPSVSVWVDNLSPYIVSTTPAHSASNVWTDAPIVIVFSEPVLPDTLQFTCQPDVGNWSVDMAGDATTIVLSHAPFKPNQMYSCFIGRVEDRAGHALVSGPALNPWAFITGPGPAPFDHFIYLPLASRECCIIKKMPILHSR